tara:strand:+ start:825 stop:1028 length:204 start_codon:yes stop_codon:yes gene_type:complete
MVQMQPRLACLDTIFKDISPQTKIDKTVNDRTHNIKSCLITIQRVISFGPQSSFEYAIENKAFLATI